MEKIKGGVTAAKGFMAAGVEAGVKYQNRKDMAMVYSTVPCVAAGTFTTNVVKAAPVLWDREIVAHSPGAQAVVINAGIANACTGKQGYECCRQTAEKAAKELGIPKGTIHAWLKAVREGRLEVGEGSHTPGSAMSLAEEITMLRRQVKELEKANRRLKEENEFLEEASAFFAASRRKSVRSKE